MKVVILHITSERNPKARSCKLLYQSSVAAGGVYSFYHYVLGQRPEIRILRKIHSNCKKWYIIEQLRFDTKFQGRRT